MQTRVLHTNSCAPYKLVCSIQTHKFHTNIYTPLKVHTKNQNTGKAEQTYTYRIQNFPPRFAGL